MAREAERRPERDDRERQRGRDKRETDRQIETREKISEREKKKSDILTETKRGNQQERQRDREGQLLREGTRGRVREIPCSTDRGRGETEKESGIDRETGQLESE